MKSKHVARNALKGADIKESALRGAPPLAYAHVVNNAVVPARSRGVTLLSSSTGGTYCLRVGGNPKNVQVTAEREGDGSVVVGNATFDTDDAAFDIACSGTPNVGIKFQDITQSFVDTDFFVVFH